MTIQEVKNMMIGNENSNKIDLVMLDHTTRMEIPSGKSLSEHLERMNLQMSELTSMIKIEERNRTIDNLLR